MWPYKKQAIANDTTKNDCRKKGSGKRPDQKRLYKNLAMAKGTTRNECMKKWAIAKDTTKNDPHEI